MAKTPARRLKVFVAQIGFYDTVVAAASQTAALKAWGTRQNLFTGGQARLIDDPQAVEAALANPEVPLRRIVGTDNPFELNPRGLPVIPDAPKKWADEVHTKRPAPPRPKKAKPPASRTKLDKAEAALRRVDDDRKREETDLRRRQEDFDAEREAAQTTYIERRRAATAAVVAARQIYRKAGGTD